MNKISGIYIEDNPYFGTTKMELFNKNSDLMSVIFGPNGAGKSTLTREIDNISNGSSYFYDSSQVKIDDNMNIQVFNEDFIDDNIHFSNKNGMSNIVMFGKESDDRGVKEINNKIHKIEDFLTNRYSSIYKSVEEKIKENKIDKIIDQKFKEHKGDIDVRKTVTLNDVIKKDAQKIISEKINKILKENKHPNWDELKKEIYKKLNELDDIKSDSFGKPNFNKVLSKEINDEIKNAFKDITETEKEQLINEKNKINKELRNLINMKDISFDLLDDKKIWELYITLHKNVIKNTEKSFMLSRYFIAHMTNSLILTYYGVYTAFLNFLVLCVPL